MARGACPGSAPSGVLRYWDIGVLRGWDCQAGPKESIPPLGPACGAAISGVRRPCQPSGRLWGDALERSLEGRPNPATPTVTLGDEGDTNRP